MGTGYSSAVLQLAERLAAELDAQVGTLAHFSSHSGEIGRAHEVYIRGALTRYLPPRLRIGTGFVAGREWTSRQLDVLVYNWIDYALLFEVGDCVVVEEDAVAACIEVKTHMYRREIKSILEHSQEMHRRSNGRWLFGAYAWNGVAIEKALEVIWEAVRESGSITWDWLPEFIYVRSKYLLMKASRGDRLAAPFWLMDIRRDGATDGGAILSMLAVMWTGGVQNHIGRRPAWLRQQWDVDPTRAREVPWPDDLYQHFESTLKK